MNLNFLKVKAIKALCEKSLKQGLKEGLGAMLVTPLISAFLFYLSTLMATHSANFLTEIVFAFFGFICAISSLLMALAALVSVAYTIKCGLKILSPEDLQFKESFLTYKNFDEKVNRESIQLYPSILNLLSSLLYYKKSKSLYSLDEFNQKMSEFELIQDDMIYIQTILEKNFYDSYLPVEIQKKMWLKQKDILNKLQINICEMYNKKILNDEFQQVLEDIPFDEKIVYLKKEFMEEKSPHKTTSKHIEEIEKEALDAIKANKTQIVSKEKLKSLSL